MNYTRNRWSKWFKIIPPLVILTALFNDIYLSEVFYILLNSWMATNNELQRMGKEMIVAYGNVEFAF